MSEPSEARASARSTTISAVAAALLSLPFLLFGWQTLDMKARVELRCEARGPCTLTRLSWLSQEEVGRFPLEELRGARVERKRKSSRSDESLWRPLLVTMRGEFPLSYAWMKEERKAQHPAVVVGRYLRAPVKGVTLWHDDRAGAGRLGGAFLAVGGLLLVMSGRLGFKARRLRRAERAVEASPAAP